MLDYSENWQLVINTVTTIITFLMVFVIQNSQSRDPRELHVKLDELLRAVTSALSSMIVCDERSDDELDQLPSLKISACGHALCRIRL